MIKLFILAFTAFLPVIMISQNLDVEGSLKVGDHNGASPSPGTIRWNPGSNDFEGFDGTSWISLTRNNEIMGIQINQESSQHLSSDIEAEDEFGRSTDVSGNYAIAGAPLYELAPNEDKSGAAYLFTREGGSWTEQKKLRPTVIHSGDEFGRSVAISGDYAIVGAWKSDEPGESSGAAYIFKRNGTDWLQEAKLTASDAVAGDYFGYSVDISGDYAIAGAWENDVAGIGSGAAYIFIRSGNGWMEQAKLTASDAGEGDNFGHSVSIDGEYAVIGSRYNDEMGVWSGATYVFKRSGTAWLQQAKLTPLDAIPDIRFGHDVAISGDRIIVSTIYADFDGKFDAGAAYIFVRQDSIWSQEARITASDATSFASFGWSVSLSGNKAIVGAPGANSMGSNSGSAYLFIRSGNQWTQKSRWMASDAAASHSFGVDLGLFENTAIIGAMWNNSGGNQAGAIYFFE